MFSVALKGRIQTAMRETKEAFARKDAPAALEKAEALRKLLKEAGAVIYAQTPSAGPYAETKYPGGTPPPMNPLERPGRPARVRGARWWTRSTRRTPDLSADFTDAEDKTTQHQGGAMCS